jgi:hypothetical protein
MWPSEETFSRQNSLAIGCWSLRLPLVGSNGQNLGAFTLYQALAINGARDTMLLDLTQTTELLSRELSAALNTLLQQQASTEPSQAVGEYVPNFKRDRVPVIR